MIFWGRFEGGVTWDETHGNTRAGRCAYPLGYKVKYNNTTSRLGGSAVEAVQFAFGGVVLAKLHRAGGQGFLEIIARTGFIAFVQGTDS